MRLIFGNFILKNAILIFSEFIYIKIINFPELIRLTDKTKSSSMKIGTQKKC